MRPTQEKLPNDRKARISGKTAELRDDVMGKEQVAIPIVEEKLEVGKQQIEKGGVRVEKRIEERPASEQVNLREEHVNVERRAVDRPIRQGELEAFKEGSVEFVERAEQAVVNKTARVVEEVIVSKDVEQRTETVNDTLRYTRVNIEQLNAGPVVTGRGYSAYDNEFRTHFKTGGYKGYTYDDYVPAYQYGYDLGSSERFRNRNWDEFEPEARTAWEQRNPGTWENVKAATRHAWAKVTGKA